MAARYRGFHLAALFAGQAAMMQCDWQIVVIVTPKLLEHHLSLRARVDEDEGRVVLEDGGIDFG